MTAQTPKTQNQTGKCSRIDCIEKKSVNRGDQTSFGFAKMIFIKYRNLQVCDKKMVHKRDQYQIYSNHLQSVIKSLTLKSEMRQPGKIMTDLCLQDQLHMTGK